MVNKPDPVRRRLSSAGLSSDDCDKYCTILRSFLSARTTKVKFEAEMLKLIPRDKIHIHNAVIRDLLARSQQRREGVPDLPVLAPAVEKSAVPRPSRDGGPKLPLRNTDKLSIKKRPKGERDRERDRERERERDRERREAGHGGDRSQIWADGDGKPGLGSDRTRPLRPPSTGQRPGVGGTPVRSSGSTLITGTDVSTYNALPFFPVRPGQSLDLDLFLKVRERMRDQAVEVMGMAGIKDDAASLMTLALEMHVKGLMEAGARQRSARQVMRPQGAMLCGPVRGRDMRDAALRNMSFLGDDAGLDLERLSLLLF